MGMHGRGWDGGLMSVLGVTAGRLRGFAAGSIHA